MRIPCRDSLPFVQAVMEAMPDFERDEIKGKGQKQNKTLRNVAVQMNHGAS